MNGLGRATFGPSSSAPGRLGVRPIRLESGPKQKSPPRTVPRRAREEGECEATC